MMLPPRKTGDSNPAACAANRLATDLQHLLGLAFHTRQE